jgi:hypothetical protein
MKNGLNVCKPVSSYYRIPKNTRGNAVRITRIWGLVVLKGRLGPGDLIIGGNVWMLHDANFMKPITDTNIKSSFLDRGLFNRIQL